MGFISVIFYTFSYLFESNISPGILKGQIDEKIFCPWVRFEPTISRAEIEKYIVRFLVQVKKTKNLFEINWPLVKTMNLLNNNVQCHGLILDHDQSSIEYE